MRYPSGRTRRWTEATSIALAAGLVLAGCASVGVATPTGTPPQPMVIKATAIAPTETPASTATSTVTSAPRWTHGPTWTPRPKQPTVTPTPTDAPLPTATSYPAPAIPLSPIGPWLVFQADGYLWAMGQDGTGLTRLTDERVCSFAVRPNSTVQGGLTIAYSTSLSGYCLGDHFWIAQPSVIKILSWPERNVKTVVYNLTLWWAQEMVWSPSGNRLAFVGAMGDTSSNVFVYDFATEESTRIAVTDDEDFRLLWSPDERYVIFQTFYLHTPSSNEPLSVGVWSARADAGGVTQLANERAPRQYPGWFSATEIVLAHLWWGETIDNLRIVNIETGKYTTIAREPFFDVAYSPEHNTFLITQWPSAPPNTLLIFYQNGERREVTGYGIRWVKWLSSYDVFLGQTLEGQSYLISPEGVLTEIPSPAWQLKRPHPVIVSPDGHWWAWHHYHSTEYEAVISASELWVGPAMAQPTVFLSFDSSEDNSTTDLTYSGNVIWSPDSQHLLWAARQGIFVASTPTFGAVRVADIFASFSDAVWVQ